jgi:hypothetical protein
MIKAEQDVQISLNAWSEWLATFPASVVHRKLLDLQRLCEDRSGIDGVLGVTSLL